MSSSRSLERICCSTAEKLASCETNSVESIGFSGSWFFICVVRSVRKVWKSPVTAPAVLAAVAVDLLDAAAALPVVVGVMSKAGLLARGIRGGCRARRQRRGGAPRPASPG